MSKVTAIRRGAGLEPDTSIIALDRFIQSTRDSGYKGTVSAIAELVDNALEASARRIDIRVRKSANGDDFEVSVLDDGTGMDAETLTEALRFGGTTRFNSRKGLGRFGMGLPNASLSQARRVEVYTWQQGEAPITSYLDVDQIVAGSLSAIPKPIRQSLPSHVKAKKSGTLVVWSRCDRLDHRRVSTVEKRLHTGLGRIFRHFLWAGTVIALNGKAIEPVDPIFLQTSFEDGGAKKFQDVITVEVATDPENPSAAAGEVEVLFTELPVAEWHELSNDEKRARGIANGAGVSIVRGKREVDFGWFFMGAKRRENYDDWWRCEIRFDPDLDDAFGITHTKQQIRAKEYLIEALQPIVEDTAKALNSRVRQKYLNLKTEKTGIEAEKLATKRHDRLRPIPKSKGHVADTKALSDLADRHARVKEALMEKSPNTKYLLVQDEQDAGPFFKPLVADGVLVAVLNSNHLFFRNFYESLVAQSGSDSSKASHVINLMLLAATRAEALFSNKDERKTLAKFRKEWSEVLDALLRS
ncbi:ATP-binding protein [Bradyrhizobium sp.]|uniref:ATP-binding protein n=1 Tax=Bradyrhizobium sp. TaxID=376 RepID=UPI002D39A23C|nr:ATP-binding protein [Bradyrhizobium sp.]HZR75127.1 ATP-binding protein [Bradyrhizobium sp.]